MYNRYIPDDTQYTAVQDEADLPPTQPQTPVGEPPPKPTWLSGLLKGFHLEDIDTGDILLILILLFLFLDGDKEGKEMAIIIGVLILFGLSWYKKQGDQPPA